MLAAAYDAIPRSFQLLSVPADRNAGEHLAAMEERADGRRLGLPIHRDLDHLAERAQARMAASEAALAATIAGETAETPRGRLIRAVAAHLVRFETWRSLVVDQGLSLDEGVETGTSWLVAVAGSTAARRT